MEYNKFNEEDLKLGSEYWRSSKNNTEDYGELYALFDNEQSIATHFTYFTVETINKFDELLKKLNDKNELIFDHILNWFIAEEECFSFNFDTEEELIEARLETEELAIECLIGYFRWCVLVEEYEFASAADKVIKDYIKLNQTNETKSTEPVR